jgi:hypothetical protein
MNSNNAIAPPHLADLIPDPETIRKYLDRCQREANLLRRLLRLALRREREAEKLKGGGHAA